MADSKDQANKAYLLQLEDMKRVMETEHGRRVLNRFLQTCGVYRTSYNPNMPETHTVFNEGQRNIGLMLIGELQEASPALFIKMMQEDNQHEIK